MKFLIKKSSADTGIGVMLMSIVTVLLMLVLMMYSFNMIKLSLLKVSIRDGLDIVCLSSVVPDIEAMKESTMDSVGFNPDSGFGIGIGNSGTDSLDFIIDEEGSFERFTEILNKNVIDVVSSDGVSDIRVEEVIFYTIEGDNITEHVFSDSGVCSDTVNVGNGTLAEVYSPNGVEVKNVGVYTRISFNYTDIFGFEHTGLSAENYKAVRLQ